MEDKYRLSGIHIVIPITTPKRVMDVLDESLRTWEESRCNNTYKT